MSKRTHLRTRATTREQSQITCASVGPNKEGVRMSSGMGATHLQVGFLDMDFFNLQEFFKNLNGEMEEI